VEAAGEKNIAEPVRGLLEARLARWNGEDPGFSSSWMDEATAGLSTGNQSAARLALMTALAAYRVDESAVAAFRDQQPSDDALVSLTAWASFAAMKRISSWL
jgi:hypothetical protein